MKVAELVRETTTTTGTGDLTLSGTAPTGFRRPQDAFGVGDTAIPFMIRGGAEWERVLCTLSGANTLQRGTVLASSNSNALVNFSAGTKDVICDLAAWVAAGGILPAPFSSTLKFTHTCQLAQQNVAGAIAFTQDTTGAMDGVVVSVHLLANGTNAPTFAADLYAWDGSSGYVNTSGVRNIIHFWRSSGVTFYSINQKNGAPVEPVPATSVILSGPTGGVSGVASTNFTVSADGAITGTVTVTPASAGGSFSPTSVNISSGTPTATFAFTPSSTGAKTITYTNNGGLLNPNSPWTYTASAAPTVPDAPTSLTLGTATSTTQPLSWTAPSNTGGASLTDYVIQWSPAGAGTWTTFSDGTSTSTSATVTGLTASTSYDYRVAAVNSVGQGAYSSTATGSTGAAPSYLRLTTATSLTESGSGPYTYAGATGGGFGDSGHGLGDKSLASSADGWYSVTMATYSSGTGFGPLLTLRTNGTNGFYTDAQCIVGVYAHTTGYQTLTNGTGGGSPSGSSTCAAGDVIRLRRSGTTVLAERSTDGGATFPTTIHTWTGITTAQLWPFVHVVQGGPNATTLNHSGLT